VDLTAVQLKEAKSSEKEARMNIARAAATDVMKAVPSLGSSLKSDPITIWSILRDRIFMKIESEFADNENPGVC
jgi:hypothetical protein